jgi:spore coat protein U-like protein
MTRFLSRVLPALALLALATTARAQTATLNIDAKVNASCRVSSAAPQISIAYDVFDSATATGNFAVQVACTKNTVVQVAADAGQHGALDGFLRSVDRGGLEAIGYKLSLTAAGAALPIGVATGTGVASAGKGTDVGVTLHATLYTGGDPSAGTYTDDVLLTFTAL